MAREKKGERGRDEAEAPPTPPISESSGDEQFQNNAPSTTSSVTRELLPPSTTIPREVLEEDKKTPDGWLARDNRLIRLTGVSYSKVRKSDIRY